MTLGFETRRSGWSVSPVEGGAENLRLALFSGNYNYTRDGANQALNRLVDFLERDGATVRVYSPTTDSPAFEPCGELISAPSIPAPGRPEYRLALGLTPRLRRDVAAFAPTMVHLSAPDLLGLGARNFARRLGVPVAASLHTRFETYLDYYGLRGLAPAASRYLHGFYAGCDRVLAPNAPMAELLEAWGLGDRVGLWGRGVDREQFSPARRDLAWRRARGIGDEDVVVLFFGRLVREKGLDAFVESLARIAESGQRVRALVVGEGPMREWLKARLSDAFFTGQLQGAELGRAVASADIFLNPSRTEAFGNVSLEAMAAGLPVVAKEAPSTRALIRDGVDGVLCRPGTPEVYAAAVVRLASDPEMRRRLGRAARATSSGYDWTAACAAVLDAYRELGALDPPARRRA